MNRYYVYRRGFNSANNSARYGGPCVAHVRTVEANSPEDAVEVALADGVTVYNNQSIWAEIAEEVEAKTAAKGRVLS